MKNNWKKLLKKTGKHFEIIFENILKKFENFKKKLGKRFEIIFE